jgi:hypothetical protein
MTWSQTFIDAIESMGDGQGLLYALEGVSAPYGVPFGGSFPTVHSMHASAGYGFQNTIVRNGSSISHGLLRARTWQYSAGVLTVVVSSEGNVRTVARRGQVVRLLAGTDPNDLQAVFVGTVNNISRRSGRWAIEVRDLLQSITSRLTTADDEARLFHDQESTTFLNVPPAVPNYSPGDTEVTLADAAGFRPSPNGLYYFEMTGNSGATFILSATSKNVSAFTGVSTSGQFGTVAENTASGNAAVEVQVLSGHPLRVARQMLVSTGSTGNGPGDVNIASCGLGLPDEVVALVDVEDFEDLSDLVTASQDRFLVLREPTANPKGVLDAWLGPNGFFLGQHQGQITVRAVVDPGFTGTPNDFDITDDDLVSVDKYEQWDPRNPAVVRTLVLTTNSGGVLSLGSDPDALESLPIVEEQLVALPGVYSDTTDRILIAEEAADRLARYFWLQAEVMTVTLRGVHWGKASAGDTCRLRFSLFDDRYGGSFDGRRGLLLQCGPNWFGSTTTAVIALLPDPVLSQVSAPL